MLKIDENNIGRDHSYILSTETDNEYVVKPVKYFGLSQEEGGVHAALCGAALKEMLDREGRTWMILRTRMTIYNYAKWMDEFNVETWCQKGYKLYCPRAVRAFLDDGTPLFSSENLWIIMNMLRSRPERPEYIESRLEEVKDKSLLFNPDFPKFPDKEEYRGRVFSDEKITINYYDYDYNRHVNNLSYINWMMLSFPPEYLDKYRPSFIDAEWKKQCHYEDILFARTIEKEDSSGEFLTIIYRLNDNKDMEVVFQSTSVWKEKV